MPVSTGLTILREFRKILGQNDVCLENTGAPAGRISDEFLLTDTSRHGWEWPLNSSEQDLAAHDADVD
jgi:hypothetical protein